MADDFEEQSKKSAEQLKKLNKEFEKLTEGLDSTTKTLFKNSNSDKQRQSILKLSTEALQENARQWPRNTAQGKLQRLQIAQQIRANRDLSRNIMMTRSTFGGMQLQVARLSKSIAELPMKAFKTAIQTITGSVKGAFNLTKNLLDAEKRFEGFGDIGDALKDVPVFGKHFNELAKTADFNIGIFRALAQTGADFNSSVIELRNSAAAAGMPLLDFVDAIKANSNQLASLFGTVQTGVYRFQGLAQGLRNITQNEFAQFGLTLDDTNEFLNTFLEFERSRVGLERLTNAELLAGTQNYIMNLVKLSKITGQSVQELDAKNRAEAQAGTTRALLNTLDQGQRKSVELAISRFGGFNSSLGRLIVQTARFGGAADGTTAQLNLFSRGALVPAIKEFLQNGNLAQLENAVRSSSNTILQNTSLLNASAAGASELQQNLDVAAQFAGEQIDEQRLQTEMLKKAGVTQNFVAALDEIKRFKAGVEKQTTDLLGLTVFGDKAGEFLGAATKGLNSLALDLAQMNIFSNVYDAGAKALRVISDFSVTGAVNSLKKFITSNRDTGQTSAGSAGDIGGEASIPLYKDGSKGFRDFGTGTLVKLHNKETVIPLNSPMGKVVASLEGAKLDQNPQKVQNVTNAINNVTAANTDYDRLAAVFSQGFTTLAGKMDESVNRLNMIAGASAKTADNTGKQIKTLARNPYSVV